MRLGFNIACAALLVSACESRVFVLFDGGTPTGEDAEPGLRDVGSRDAGPDRPEATVLDIGGIEDTPCAEFTVSRDSLGNYHRAYVALPLKSGDALIGHSTDRGDGGCCSGEYVLVGASGTLSRLPYTTADEPTAGFIRADDEFWLIAGLRLHRASLDQITPTNLVSHSGTRFIAGSPADETLEIFILEGSTSLVRSDGQTFETLWTQAGLSAAAKNDDAGAVIRVAAGEAYAVPHSGQCQDHVPCVVHYDRRAAVAREEPTPVVSGPTTVVASIPGLGLLAGTREGRLLERKEGVWTEIPRSPIFDMSSGTGGRDARAIRAILPLDDGVALFSDDWVAQWHPGYGFCRPFGIDSPTITMIHGVAQLGTGFVFTGLHQADTLAHVAILTRVKRGPP